MTVKTIATVFCLLAGALPAQAELKVRFIEGAPKDLFTIENEGECALTGRVLINLATSPAGLIFDVTEQGAGVEVFQPFELVSGRDHISSLPEVLDGQTAVELELIALPSGEMAAFSIDVDNTVGPRPIVVSGSEIAGGMVQFAGGGHRAISAFDEMATARLKQLGACQS